MKKIIDFNKLTSNIHLYKNATEMSKFLRCSKYKLEKDIRERHNKTYAELRRELVGEPDLEIHNQKGKYKTKIHLDWGDIAQMLEARCSVSSICAKYVVNKETLYRRCLEEKEITWTDFKQQNQMIGEDNIKQIIYQRAIAGNDKMLIFLAKNWLGYSENPTSDKETDTLTPHVVNFNMVKEATNEK